MKILDANLLLYAVNKDAALHSPAKRWLEMTLSGDETVGFSWNVILAVLRLTTRPGVFQKPLSIEQAFDLIAGWVDHPRALLVHPGPRHFAVFRSLITPLGTGGNLTSDAHLAALAVEHNAELCSCDNDFARFPGLDWRNPLIGA
jgi:toxin-antitoxin system PIN domain toxin